MSNVRAVKRTPPIVAIVGASKSGKTTLLESLIARLKSRGYKVGTIKHALANLSFDKAYKDSWRHIQAGSAATLILSSTQLVLIKPVLHELTLGEAAQLLGADYDILLAEGFKQSEVPKIKLYRDSEGANAFDLKNLIAVVTEKPIECGVRNFSPKAIDELVDFLEENFLKPKRKTG